MKKLSIFLLIALAIVYSGCASTECKPVLFPHIEYGYRAEPQKLPGTYTPNKGNEIIEFYNLKIAKPEDWKHEIPFEKTLHLFPPGKDRSVIISYESPRTFEPDDFKGMHLIGCDNFEVSNNQETKTTKDYITDLYLFTSEQFENREFKPTFWHYFVLWNKIKVLGNVEKIVHYQGHNFEAFRRDRKKTGSKLYSLVDLFYKKHEPSYFTISTTFEDDAFVNSFIDMIDVLN